MIPVHEARWLSDEDVATVQSAVRTRVLRLFARRGLIPTEAAAEMRQWDHGGGFSLDAAVRIEATDRKGLERLAPAGERVVYSLPKPGPLGQTALSLTPIEFLERVAMLIPPPRRHRHRYHGVLAPTVSPGAKRDRACGS